METQKENCNLILGLKGLKESDKLFTFKVISGTKFSLKNVLVLIIKIKHTSQLYSLLHSIIILLHSLMNMYK